MPDFLVCFPELFEMEFQKGKERVTIQLSQAVFLRAAVLKQYRETFLEKTVEKFVSSSWTSMLVEEVACLVQWPQEVQPKLSNAFPI